MAFGDNATLTGVGELTGTTAVAFSELATVIGKGGLDGTIPVTFGGTADLTNGASILAGTIAVTFDDNATLTAKGALQGTLSVTFSSTADLTPSTIILGGVYNAVEYFNTGSSVTIAVFDPVTGDAVAINTATVNEAPGNNGHFIWDAANITTQPTGYQEYGYVMTDGSNPEGGVIRMNLNDADSTKLLEVWQRLGLDETNPLTTNDDNSITFADVTLTAVNADTSTTQTREDA